VQVAGLAVVEGVGAAGRGGVVAWRLVCEGGKGEAVGVQERGRKSPGLMAAARRGVLVFEVFLVGDVVVVVVVVVVDVAGRRVSEMMGVGMGGADGVRVHGVCAMGMGTMAFCFLAYRVACATSSASVRAWPGGAASECERWPWWGNAALNSSRPAGFRVLILGIWSRAVTCKQGGRQAPTGCETWRSPAEGSWRQRGEDGMRIERGRREGVEGRTR